MEMIKQLFAPQNRQVKRAMENERERINRSVGTLLQIEDEFIGNLFNNDVNNYDEIYKHYLAQYVEHSKYHAARLNLKYYKIDSYYFKNQFQPLEKCKS